MIGRRQKNDENFRPFLGESELIQIAYAFEQATKHRRPPEKFPKLR